VIRKMLVMIDGGIDCRHRREQSRQFLVNGLDHLNKIKARQHDDLAAHDDGDVHHRRHGEDMEKRQNAEHNFRAEIYFRENQARLENIGDQVSV
jgi:hypothetical protein